MFAWSTLDRRVYRWQRRCVEGSELVRGKRNPQQATPARIPRRTKASEKPRGGIGQTSKVGGVFSAGKADVKTYTRWPSIQTWD